MENERLSPVTFEIVKGDDIKHFNDYVMDDVSVMEKRIRRRSSVFAEVRKSLLESKKEGTSNESQIEKIQPEEDQVDKYNEELRNEKKEWLNVTNKRKRDYSDTSKKYNDHCKKRRVMTEKECLPYLSEMDEKYLEDLPKFEPISMKYRKLKMSQEILKEQRKGNIEYVMHLLDLFSQDTEAKIEKIVKYSKTQPL